MSKKSKRKCVYFENICRMSQKTLKKHMRKMLEEKYEEVVYADGFVFAKGTVPILLVAHMDTVHKTLPQIIEFNNGKISSPQGIGGDDRCGIYMISKIIQQHHCSVLFTEDEETGGIGASKFVHHNCSNDLEFNYIIELDRRGKDDAVFYECDNPEFEDFITKDGDWKTNWGSYSDICDVAPALGCAAVNLSCGYYNAHTEKEYVVFSEMEANIKKVCKLIERTTENDVFEYIEAKYTWGKYGMYGGWSNDGYSNDYPAEDFYFMITFVDLKGKTDYADYLAANKYEAIGLFAVDHPELTYNDIVDIDNFGQDIYSF
ncbi:MAG: hypothetical protein PUE12_18490 [Oscillospiraceae bacterium]|nr:hypothetical protein [Oscillospiraceae bacterium]